MRFLGPVVHGVYSVCEFTGCWVHRVYMHLGLMGFIELTWFMGFRVVDPLCTLGLGHIDMASAAATTTTAAAGGELAVAGRDQLVRLVLCVCHVIGSLN